MADAVYDVPERQVTDVAARKACLLRDFSLASDLGCL